jgi:predicted amidohydrolase YtcJ
MPTPDRVALAARRARYVAQTCLNNATTGTITASKTVDLVIRDTTPLTVAPEKIRAVKVVETIKRGKTVCRRR